MKTDHGPGCKSEWAIKFWCDMHLEGIHFGPGLPNATSANQEVDDFFQDFKGKYNACTQEVFKEKMYAHALVLNCRQDNGETEIKN